MLTVFHSPIVQAALKGALAGAGAAALVDFNNFRAWKNWHDALTYDWGIATFRWIQGAFMGGVIGASTALGINLIS